MPLPGSVPDAMCLSWEIAPLPAVSWLTLSLKVSACVGWLANGQPRTKVTFGGRSIKRCNETSTLKATRKTKRTYPNHSHQPPVISIMQQHILLPHFRCRYKSWSLHGQRELMTHHTASKKVIIIFPLLNMVRKGEMERDSTPCDTNRCPGSLSTSCGRPHTRAQSVTGEEYF